MDGNNFATFFRNLEVFFSHLSNIFPHVIESSSKRFRKSCDATEGCLKVGIMQLAMNERSKGDQK